MISGQVKDIIPVQIDQQQNEEKKGEQKVHQAYSLFTGIWHF
jgi:hypothetical protein